MAIVEQKLHDRKELWFHIWYAKTMSNHDDDGNKNPNFAYLTMKNSICARFARAFFIF